MYASSATAFAVSAVSVSADPAADALRQTIAVVTTRMRCLMSLLVCAAVQRASRIAPSRVPSLARGEVEDVGTPGWKIEIDAAVAEVVAVRLVRRDRVHEVTQVDSTSRQVFVGQPDIALSLRRAVVGDDEQPPARARPDERDEALPRGIALPRGLSVAEPPVAVAHLRTTHAGKEAVVVRHELLVDDLPRPAAEVMGRPPAPPLALPVVDEAEPRDKERERRGGLMNRRREDGGGARLVVILEKTDGPALVVGIGQEVAAHSDPVLVAQAVVETFVVGVVEPLLLEGPLEIPVRFGHEDEVRPALAHARDGRRPEGLVDGRAAVGRPRAIAPGATHDVWQHEHRHVAPHSISLRGDAVDHPEHRLTESKMTIIDLEGVGPAREERVAPVRKYPGAPERVDSDVVRRLAREVNVRSVHVELGMLADPGMIQRRVVGHEIEHELDAAIREPLAESRERP